MSSLADVHQKFGEASETAQLLETELGNILLAIEGRESGLFFGDRQEEAAEILRGINKSTLGQLFRKLQARASVSTVRPISWLTQSPNVIACHIPFFASTISENSPLRAVASCFRI